jgi:hypothetical protein
MGGGGDAYSADLELLVSANALDPTPRDRYSTNVPQVVTRRDCFGGAATITIRNLRRPFFQASVVPGDFHAVLGARKTAEPNTTRCKFDRG